MTRPQIPLQSPDLSKLRELLEKATPGPWLRGSDGFSLHRDRKQSSVLVVVSCGTRDGEIAEADVELVREAVNALPHLLTHVEEYNTLIERMREPTEEDIERIALAIHDVKGGVNYDYMDFCRDAARAAATAGLPASSVVLHVAGNGQALRMADVEEVIERIEIDAVEASEDAVRLIRFLAHVASLPSTPGGEG